MAKQLSNLKRARRDRIKCEKKIEKLIWFNSIKL